MFPGRRVLVLVVGSLVSCKSGDKSEPASKNTAADPPPAPIDPGGIKVKLPPDFPITIPADAWISFEHDRSDAGGELEIGIDLPGEPKVLSAQYKAVLEQAGFEITWRRECAMEDPSEWAYGMRCELTATSDRGTLRITVKQPVKSTDSHVGFAWRKK